MSAILAVFYDSAHNKPAVAWLCFLIGIALLVFGVVFAFIASKQLEELKKAKADLARAEEDLRKAQDDLKKAKEEHRPALRAGNEVPQVQEATTKTAAAEEKKAAAESVVQQVGSIVGSLPEAYRFPGLLVLLGVALISVATIQFGGVSLF